MKMRCIKGCVLEVWDGSGDKVRVFEGEELVMSYHEYDGSIGLTMNDGKELFCGRGEVERFEEVA